MMRRAIGLLVTLVLGLLVAPLAAEAPPAGKVARLMPKRRAIVVTGVPCAWSACTAA
jgi:hypothetical protein